MAEALKLHAEKPTLRVNGGGAPIEGKGRHVALPKAKDTLFLKQNLLKVESFATNTHVNTDPEPDPQSKTECLSVSCCLGKPRPNHSSIGISARGGDGTSLTDVEVNAGAFSLGLDVNSFASNQKLPISGSFRYCPSNDGPCPEPPTTPPPPPPPPPRPRPGPTPE